MSHATDVLGKAVSVDLDDLRYDELSAAICALQKVMGVTLMTNIIKNGLLLTRRKITLGKWDDALKSMKKAIKSVPPPPKKESPPPSLKSTSPRPRLLAEPMDVDEAVPPSPLCESPKSPPPSPKPIVHFFDDGYFPTELISKLFTYLDSRSHGYLENCNKRLLIISRNPSSNLFLGCHFEGGFYRSDYSTHPLLCPSIQFALKVKVQDPLERIKATTHRFEQLKRLTLCNDGLNVTDEVWERLGSAVSDEWLKIGMFPLLHASERHVEELVICEHSMYDMRKKPFQSLHSDDISVLPNLKHLR